MIAPVMETQLKVVEIFTETFVVYYKTLTAKNSEGWWQSRPLLLNEANGMVIQDEDVSDYVHLKVYLLGNSFRFAKKTCIFIFDREIFKQSL